MTTDISRANEAIAAVAADRTSARKRAGQCSSVLVDDAIRAARQAGFRVSDHDIWNMADNGRLFAVEEEADGTEPRGPVSIEPLPEGATGINAGDFFARQAEELAWHASAEQEE